jgi:hypothetical protein
MAAMDMALVAIGLLVVALAIMAIVLVRRLDALERDVSTRRQVDGLGERLDRLTDQVEQRKLGDQLQVKLTEFSESMARLSAAIAELQQKRRGETGAVASWSDDISAIVRRHLQGGGCGGVQILTDAGELTGLSGRVAFEGRRKGVMVKGWVAVEDGVVVDEQIRSAYSAFP